LTAGEKSNISDQGEFSASLIAMLPSTVPNPSKPDSSLLPTSSQTDSEVKSVVTDNNSSDTTNSDNKAVEKVSQRNRSKAAELIKLLKNHPDEISWTDDGKLFLHGEALPDANFFDLFPKLFVKSKTKEPPHLTDLANAVSTMGFGHLIHRNHTTGLMSSRKKIFENSRADIKKRFEIGKRWYYLGP
jgi:hypothetical protein